MFEATDDRGCYPSDAAAILDALGSADKQHVVLAADHYLRRPLGARDVAADRIAAWIERACDEPARRCMTCPDGSDRAVRTRRGTRGREQP